MREEKNTRLIIILLVLILCVMSILLVGHLEIKCGRVEKILKGCYFDMAKAACNNDEFCPFLQVTYEKDLEFCLRNVNSDAVTLDFENRCVDEYVSWKE